MDPVIVSLIVQSASGVIGEQIKVLYARFRASGLSAKPGLDLGDRGPERAGGHAVTAVVVNAFGVTGKDGERELGRASREIVRWLASAPPAVAGWVRVEVVNQQTGAVARIDSETPTEAAALLGPILGSEWASAPMVWNGSAWTEETEPTGSDDAPAEAALPTEVQAQAVLREQATPASPPPGSLAPKTPAAEPDTSAAAPAKGSSGQRVLLVVADEWLPAKGGLSAMSRYLCRAFAALSLETYCVVPELSAKDTEDAEAGEVRLIAAPVEKGRPRHEGLMRRPELPDGVEPDIIIGHSWITGYYACEMQRHFPDAQRVHFIHMSADDTPFHKQHEPGATVDEAAVAEERGKAEEALARGANLTVCVGPLLHDWFSRHVHEKGGIAAPVRLDPGFDDPDGFGAEPRTRPPGIPRILLFGRLSDEGIKGVDLAARAVGAAMRGRSPHREVELLVRGARPGEGRALKERLEDIADCPAVTVLPRNFTDDLTDVRNDLRTSSLVLMPSRVEGFGLAGLEAITSGTPVLISGASGLGRLVEELLSQDMPEMINRLVVPVRNGKRHEDANVDDWRVAISMALGNLDAAFADAATVRAALAEKRTWAMAATRLLDELRR
ncbi:glycosyltransferase family 4 protein [Streptomyces muensis]|uniref:D-inositol 3-phosphate glycosyltransferase n=1 Tax=Streptomyces muensis TaxID=1077944 RepID=A0A9X1PWH4_STRM4|nr:glycosyltransferase family 4 protein [Streptomyces muensis]MCF1593043.1 glycosyltransferase family 4 protein [Streptomyces muensis]